MTETVRQYFTLNSGGTDMKRFMVEMHYKTPDEPYHGSHTNIIEAETAYEACLIEYKSILMDEHSWQWCDEVTSMEAVEIVGDKMEYKVPEYLTGVTLEGELIEKTE
jgi:hypothetical protein